MLVGAVMTGEMMLGAAMTGEMLGAAMTGVRCC